MTTGKTRIMFALAVALQIILLIGIVAYRQYWVSTGNKYLLRPEPVDPRDILRGDYVALSYDINRINAGRTPAGIAFERNDDIYVLLADAGDGTVKFGGASKQRPSPDIAFIRGRVEYKYTDYKFDVEVADDLGNAHNLRPTYFSGHKVGDIVTFCVGAQGRAVYYFDSSQKNMRCDSQSTPLTGTVKNITETRTELYNIKYGIESYFVEEGRGRAIETASRDKSEDVKVEISVNKDGGALITKILINGRGFR